MARQRRLTRSPLRGTSSSLRRMQDRLETERDQISGRGRGGSSGRGRSSYDTYDRGGTRSGRTSSRGERTSSRERGERGERRDPAWFGQPRRHAEAARKGWRTRKRSTRCDPGYESRDPAWFGEPRRHAAAARRGWETRRGSSSRSGSSRGRRSGGDGRRTSYRSPAQQAATRRMLAARRAQLASMGMGRGRGGRSSGRRDPAWFGQSRRHSCAAQKGWRTRRRSERDLDFDFDGRGERGFSDGRRGRRGARDFF